MSFPGFTANASLPATAPRHGAWRGALRHEPLGRLVAPALPGQTERAYMDCVTDCRIAARLHQISDVSKCIRACATEYGTAKETGPAGGTGAAPPPAVCASGSVPVTCPDGFVGCCPSLFSTCVILPFVGRWCV